MKTLNSKTTTVLRYPRLDTVLMVEETIKNSDEEYTLTQLWKVLPKKVMYQTFKVIIQYLLDSNKIMIHNKLIIWIYNPKRVQDLEKRGLIIR
jgi:hypothetical protein